MLFAVVDELLHAIDQINTCTLTNQSSQLQGDHQCKSKHQTKFRKNQFAESDVVQTIHRKVIC